MNALSEHLPRLSRVRALVLGLSLLVAAVALARIFGRFTALEEWLFFRYTVSWAGTLAFVLSCLSVGNLIVGALSAPGELQDGRVVLAFSTGVYAFFLAIFATGLVGALNGAAFVLVPLVLFLVGAPKLVRDVAAWRERRRGRPLVVRFTPYEVLGIAAGAVALVALYLPVLVPENAAYDSRWYHLGTAEHYAAAGAIRRFPEGVLLGVMPQLAPILYTWAFLLPGGELFDRVELAAHLEFACFAFTLAGVPVLVRYLMPGVRARFAWLAVFFFPSVFTYDSSLHIAADRVAALFAIPAYVTMARALRELRPSACALLVVQLCGLVMTKYTALVAAVFPMAAVAVRSLQFGAGRLSRREVPKGWFWGPLTAVVLGLVLSTPHWLKNWLWYGDPFYPLLRRYFQVRPWTPDSEYFYQVFSSQNWVPTGTPREKLEGLVRALFDYSIRIYNWPDFHKDFPTFGSLFTFCLVGLVILGWKRRLWALVLGIHLGIAVWFMLFQHERYLQPLVPLMAGVCSSVAVLAWKQGWAARVGVLALGGVQLVWGLDIVFWPLHKMTGKSGIELASEFFARGYDKNYGARLRPFEDLASIGRTLPKSANVLLHRDHLRTGLGTRTVWDALRVQLGISYGALGSARALHRKLKEFEVTHVVWEYARASEEDSLAGELVFHTYASRSLLNRKTFGRKSVAEVPLDEPPPERAAVFYFGCRGQPASGLYRIEDLNVQVYWRLPGTPPPTYPAPRVPLENDLDVLVAAADRAIIERSCPQAPQELDGFEEVARSDARIYFARRLEK